MKLTNQIKSIAIGSFDGLHLGHMALVGLVEAVVVIERNGGYLTPGHQRSLYTSKPCFFYHFEKIKTLSPVAFVARLKEDFPQLNKIVVGYDFAFGKAKSGNVHTLEALFDGEVVVVAQVTSHGVAVHSRTIKAYLKEGNIAMANALLGREYLIEGEVIHGQGLGKKALYATLNLFVDHYQLPLEGVYATRSKVGGVWYSSVTFLGHRVSTDGKYAVETHLLDTVIESTQGFVEVAFVAFLRENKKFESLNLLRKQIEEDISQSRSVLKNRSE